MRPPPPWAVTGALAAAALGLCLPGIGFGLPLLSNLYVRPDESLLVVPAVELLVRHGNPGHVGYPALMIEALSALFHLLHRALARAAPPHLRAGVVLAAGLAGVAATLPETVLLDRSLAREDSRTQAGRWITDNVPPGVPVVWLGEPESEPQLNERAASLGRRVAYAERRYGTAAARVIDRAYLLLMRAPAARAAGAREIHRNPRPGSLASPLICVVSARHPLPTVRTNPRLLAAWTRGRVVREEVFGGPPEQVRGLWARYDAFFLPMSPERALQPGPELRVSLVERAAAAP